MAIQKEKEEREPKLIVATGAKGVGKTHTTNKVIEQYLKGNPSTGAVPRKVLIIDVNGEYTDYKRLALNDVLKFTVHPKIEARRIAPYKADGNKMSMSEVSQALSHALDNFRGGLLIIEDPAKYTTASVSLDVSGAISTMRHIDCDVIMHFQSIGRAGTPIIKANMNILRFHKTLDTVSRHENKFEEYSEILKIAEQMIDNSFNKGKELLRDTKSAKRRDEIKNQYMRFFVYVDFDENNIKGNFTKEQFIEAITAYIQDNEKDTIQKYLKKKDRKGKTIYNYEKALIQCENDLFEEYYGNK